MQLSLDTAADDGEVQGSQWYPDGEAQGLQIGYWDTDKTWGYFRFALTAPVPQGALIKSASLTLVGNSRDTWNPQTNALQIHLEDSADAAVVSGADANPSNGTGRVLTKASVRWPSSGGLDWGVDGKTNTSPDLGAMLQEAGTKRSLPAGTHVQLWVVGADPAQGVVEAKRFGDAQNPNPTSLAINLCR
jgi:hypothetical protein